MVAPPLSASNALSIILLSISVLLRLCNNPAFSFLYQSYTGGCSIMLNDCNITLYQMNDRGKIDELC
jgi:hypothetical protein